MKNRILLILLTAMLALSMGLISCGGGGAPEITKYYLFVSSTEGGLITTPGEGRFIYEEGEVANLVAEAEEGYQFLQWTGSVDTVGDVNAGETTITVNNHCSIIANFGIPICDWYDLDAIRNNPDGSYVLMNDLDYTSAGYAELAGLTADGGEGWEPIGGLSVDPFSSHDVLPVDPFIGNLDGQGHEIRDLFIGRPDEDGVALFGSVSGGMIENLGVAGADVAGRLYVGSLVGCASSGSTVNDSYSTGSVTGDKFVGNLVGLNLGTLGDSHSTGSVTGGEAVGGLVGGNHRTVRNSYSTGNVSGENDVGGLVGANWHTVNDSYSTGSVMGSGTVGGLVGWNHHGTISSSYSTGSVTGDSPIGGLVGEIHDCTVINSYYDYDEVPINGRNVITVGALPKEDFEQWLANDRFLDINERLAQEDGHYVISDVGDFKQLLAFGQDGSLKFRLTNDLDLADEPNFYIPYLAGEFDGNGHKIANLSFSFDFISQVGLFGYIASRGTVIGVTVENVEITGAGIVGGLAGENEGTVAGSCSTGRVAGYWSVGGLVGSIGWNGGTVSNSYYNYDDFLINGRHVVTIGALFDQDFNEWLTNHRFLDISERLSQEDGYYLVEVVSDFKQLLAFGQNDTLRFRLTKDLNLSDEPNFYIPYLAGELHGNGHPISNLRLEFDSVAQVGLFGYIASGGKVTQLGVEDIHIDATGYQQVGGLVAENCGTVSNSYSTGSLAWGGGGLIGWNEATLHDSYSAVSVTGSNVGGLVGWNYGGTVSKCHSMGSVTGESEPGGLVSGNSDGATVFNSFWDMETSDVEGSDGGTGKTTAQMKDIATFSGAGWNITAVAPGEHNPSCIWNIVDGQTYPFLSWEATA